MYFLWRIHRVGGGRAQRGQVLFDFGGVARLELHDAAGDARLLGQLGRHGVVRIDGGSSTKQRGEAIKDFREESGIKVLIGNLQSMGTGTDGLQEVAWHAVFAEADWTPPSALRRWTCGLAQAAAVPGLVAAP